MSEEEWTRRLADTGDEDQAMAHLSEPVAYTYWLAGRVCARFAAGGQSQLALAFSIGKLLPSQYDEA